MQPDSSNNQEESCHHQPQPDKAITMTSNEVERISCECCEISEDCTPTYISKIREKFYGKWLCGLCSEAVKEKKRKYHMFTNEQALEAHMAICKQFNRSTRVNPDLSLANAMMNLAKKRSQLRDSRVSFPASSCGCHSWIGVKPQLDSTH